jgi:hypothetical protein
VSTRVLKASSYPVPTITIERAVMVCAGRTSTVFMRGPGLRSIAAIWSKEQAEPVNSADGRMSAILEACKREFDAAERACKNEFVLICEQRQSSSMMIMMQIMASITTGRQNEKKDRKAESAREMNNSNTVHTYENHAIHFIIRGNCYCNG